jgi:cyclopropane-fatty-acyl-phospholipid synthase
MEWYIRLAETGLIPDFLLRIGIRRILHSRLKEFRRMDVEAEARYITDLADKFSRGPIAVTPERANEQHYELPPEFFELFLGKYRKYSSGFWPELHGGKDEEDAGPSGRGEGVGVRDEILPTRSDCINPSPVRPSLADALDASEEAMLDLTVRRARIEDGDRILDLGCGWGSFSLYAAERFPASRITAVSGSKYQIEHINREAVRRGLDNVRAELSDINDFHPRERFDRVVSVEMFEHMKNYRELFGRIAGWLEPGGRLFVHIFSHIRYSFEYPDDGSWMARTFFTGGTMPSDHLLLYFSDDFAAETHWRVSGRHYRKTLRAWLEKYDRNRSRILPILESVYGPAAAKRWFVYWRLFLMGCEETFGLGGGNEFIVSHYLFRKG